MSAPGTGDETSVDLTFRMLALDVLSGRPAPRGSAPELVDAYEVWAYRRDPAAVVILRSFEAGALVACAAFTPPAVAADARFAGAIDRLAELRLPGTAVASAEGRLSDLELLDTVPAFERIARALALGVETQAADAPARLTGSPSEATLDYFDALRMLDPFNPAATAPAELFELMADELLEEPERLRWSGARERAGDERMEVLVHVAEPSATVLVHFRAPAQPPVIAAYLPPLDADATHERLLDDIRAMIATRALATSAPTSLPSNGAFRRLGPERALAQLEDILEDVDAGEGCMHEFPPAAGPAAGDAAAARGLPRVTH